MPSNKPKSRRKRRRKPKGEVWQGHHLRYPDKDGWEWIERVRRKEHFYLTRLSYFKGFSIGFRIAMLDMLKNKPHVDEPEMED